MRAIITNLPNDDVAPHLSSETKSALYRTKNSPCIKLRPCPSRSIHRFHAMNVFNIEPSQFQKKSIDCCTDVYEKKIPNCHDERIERR